MQIVRFVYKTDAGNQAAGDAGETMRDKARKKYGPVFIPTHSIPAGGKRH
jgi:hypothetical protein